MELNLTDTFDVCDVIQVVNEKLTQLFQLNFSRFILLFTLRMISLFGGGGALSMACRGSWTKD